MNAASERVVAGRCLCGDVQYVVADRFAYALNCHCSNCRRATGGAFKPFAGIRRDSLRITTGEGGLKMFGDESAHDAHCGRCGSLLYSVVRDGAFLHVTLGTLVDAPSIRPSAHIFVGSKAPWFEIDDELPQYDEHVPARTDLFRSGAYRVRELAEPDVPFVQSFYEANPAYFLAVNGMPPRADEARQEFDDRPPSSMRYARQSMLGYFDADRQLVAVASVVVDLLAEHVWHIGLFIVATALHGSGRAAQMHASLQRWMAGQGAQWIRLGVVVGNTRAERFWARQGYTQVRQRHGVQLGQRSCSVRVLVKSLGGRKLEDYLAMVERDRPDSTSP